MAMAKWRGVVLAESDAFEMVEGNVYFPPDTLNRDYFQASDHHTTCGWKGEASYFHVKVDGVINADAAWFYTDPLPAAANIKDHVAFWHGVEVTK